MKRSPKWYEHTYAFACGKASSFAVSSFMIFILFIYVFIVFLVLFSKKIEITHLKKVTKIPIYEDEVRSWSYGFDMSNGFIIKKFENVSIAMLLCMFSIILNQNIPNISKHPKWQKYATALLLLFLFLFLFLFLLPLLLLLNLNIFVSLIIISFRNVYISI